MMEIPTDVLIQYGAMGVMVAYMMYDRQVVLKELINTLKAMRAEIAELRVEFAKVQRRDA